MCLYIQMNTAKEGHVFPRNNEIVTFFYYKLKPWKIINCFMEPTTISLWPYTSSSLYLIATCDRCCPWKRKFLRRPYIHNKSHYYNIVIDTYWQSMYSITCSINGQSRNYSNFIVQGQNGKLCFCKQAYHLREGNMLVTRTTKYWFVMSNITVVFMLTSQDILSL